MSGRENVVSEQQGKRSRASARAHAQSAHDWCEQADSASREIVPPGGSSRVEGKQNCMHGVDAHSAESVKQRGPGRRSRGTQSGEKVRAERARAIAKARAGERGRERTRARES
eukprot:6181243-Pleurochrysis_carterae.AAC.1